MQYKILHSDTRLQLEKKVNEFFGMGWEVCGGISVSSGFDKEGVETDTTFFQAVQKAVW